MSSKNGKEISFFGMTNILTKLSKTHKPFLPKPRQKVLNFNGQPRPKQTIAVLVIIVILSGLALLASYIYDDVNNNDQNSTRKQDLSYIAGELSSYHKVYGYYPTLKLVNSSTFSIFAVDLNRTKFKDPAGSSNLLSATVMPGIYSYKPIPAGCSNQIIKCTDYKLTAVLSEGNDYSISPIPTY